MRLCTITFGVVKGVWKAARSPSQGVEWKRIQLQWDALRWWGPRPSRGELPHFGGLTTPTVPGRSEPRREKNKNKKKKKATPEAVDLHENNRDSVFKRQSLMTKSYH